MTSSENLPSVEAWSFRAAFADSWLPEAYARDTETLTKALQKTFSNNNNNNNSNDITYSVTETLACDFTPPFVAPETPTVSNVSGSDPETLPKRQRTAAVGGPNSGKITKRKARASKKTQTTFITADPANFRQMVQQVTGVRFGSAQVAMAPVLKPEPQRPGGRLHGIGGGSLPTLDTSAFLLDHHQQLGQAPGAGVGSVLGSGHFDFQTSLVGDGASTGLEFDALSNFPTLESWKVM